MKREFKKKLGTVVAFSMLTLMTAQYASASSYTATNSYTVAVGPGKSASYQVTLNPSRARYTFEIKDPTFWHEIIDHEEKYLTKSIVKSGSSSIGSKKAYWRGWVDNGKITVTV